MGRHSAGDADLDDQLEEVAEPAAVVESAGRHSRTDESGEVGSGEVGSGEVGSGAAIEEAAAAQSDTEPIDLIAAIGGKVEVGPPDDGPAAEPAAPFETAAREGEAASPEDDSGAAPVAPRAPSGTRADLKLLRQSATLRVRCIGAVVATFLIYTVVLIVLGRTDVYLLWVWIPTVLSGILVGSFLDAAHR